MTARLALVGVSSLLGKEIKDQLAASGFPGTAVELFDLDDVAGILTDYGAEARVFAKAVTERVLGHELVCFCGHQKTAAEYFDPLLGAGGLGLDCSGAWLHDERAFVWVPGSTTPPQLETQRATAIPQAAALVLGATAAALGDRIARSAANVFLPASERGDAGIQELSQQSTAVMNLLDLDDQVFGRRQAFDLFVPGAEHPLSSESLGATLSRLGIATPAVNVISAPVFHGIAVSWHVAGATTEEVATALREAGFPVVDDGSSAGSADSPVQAVGKLGVQAMQLRSDGGGVWIWAVADNLQTRAAAAVAAIHTLLGTPVSEALQ